MKHKNTNTCPKYNVIRSTVLHLQILVQVFSVQVTDNRVFDSINQYASLKGVTIYSTTRTFMKIINVEKPSADKLQEKY